MKIANNENKKICSKCNRCCCKNSPCTYIPDDLKLDEITIPELICKIEKSGYLSIVWANGFLYMRPRRKEGPIIDFKIVGDGLQECSLLTEKGCSLSFKERPTGGKALVPQEDGKCYSTLSNNDFYKMWKPYQSLLKIVMEAFIE